MEKIDDPKSPCYGIVQLDAIDVWHMRKGVYQYYVDAWAFLDLRLAADAVGTLNLNADNKHFTEECRISKVSPHKSPTKTFRRIGLHEGYLCFGIEEEGEGVYAFWEHTCLV